MANITYKIKNDDSVEYRNYNTTVDVFTSKWYYSLEQMKKAWEEVYSENPIEIDVSDEMYMNDEQQYYKNYYKYLKWMCWNHQISDDLWRWIVNFADNFPSWIEPVKEEVEEIIELNWKKYKLIN